MSEMTSPIVFCDTESTGLLPDDEVWEFAGRRRDPDGTVQDLHLFIEHDKNKAELLPPSFYHDYRARYPHDPARFEERSTTYAASQLIQQFTAGCHIIGAVPSFDTIKLSEMMRRHRLEPKWHYHLTDIENVILGYLAGRGQLIDPPWKSDALSRAVHVEPTDFHRHTAMGDVLWVEAQWDAVMRVTADV